LIENINDKYYVQDNKTFLVSSKKLLSDKCITGILNQVNTECRYTKTHKNTEISYVEPNIILTWKLPKTTLNQNCKNQEIIIEGDNLIKAFNCTIQINDISISNTLLDYTQTVYVNNNVTKLETLAYIEAKEIFDIKTKDTFQNVLITSIIVLIIIIMLYFVYKYKSIPKKIIVKFKKQVPTPIEPPNIVNNQVIENDNNINPILYPNLSA
jgi:hypothetical protein